MVVDDDDHVRNFVQMSLEMEGFRMITAVNGNDANSQLAKGTPDLVVTDLMMPGQGGFEFLRTIQATTGTRVPIMVITGSTLDASTMAMIKQEANVIDVFSKPIRMAQFVATIHRELKTQPSGAAPASGGINERRSTPGPFST
jgi:two-component system response regulator MtrA